MAVLSLSLLSLGSAGLIALASLQSATAAAVPLRVMPLGASNTDGKYVPGGYRINLEQLMENGHRTNFTFVGTQVNGPAELSRRNHEGHPGWRIDEILHGKKRGGGNVAGRTNNVDKWLAVTAPDVVLLQIGTNDVLQNYHMAGAPKRLRLLGARICADRPGVKLVLSSLVPRPGYYSRVKKFNAAVPGVAEQLRRAGCSTSFVDVNAAIQPPSAYMLTDNTHMNRAGYDKMAAAWFPTLASLYDHRSDPVSVRG